MKKTLFLVLALMLLLSVAGCGSKKPANDPGNNSGNNNNSNNNNNNNEESFKYTKDYINNVLKGDYSITYRYTTTTGGGGSIELTSIHTSEGYCLKAAGTETLYIKNDAGTYDMYTGAGGKFVKIPMDPLTEADVQSMSFAYNFMQKAAATKGLTKAGSETVAGRDCEKYTQTATGYGSTFTAVFYVDKATGICMKFSYDVDSANEGQSFDLTFECLEFKTSGVTFPKYK